MSNVIPIRRVPRHAARITHAEEAMRRLRIELYEWDAHDLAAEVGVSYSCIMNIRSGRTKWPRPKTFFNLLEALGLQMFLVKI